jgi:hypothetical protein
MLRNLEFFGEQDLALVYIAKRLKQATQLEALLTVEGFDYLVEADTYRGGVIFVGERVGAFFYVAPADEERCRMFLSANGFKPYTTD